MAKQQITIGVLALQGDFAEHIAMLTKLGVSAIPVRTVTEAETTQGIIIPGGESTVIGKLLHSSGLHTWLKQKAKQHFPIYGTCAGSILLAKQVDSEFSLQVMDIAITRNAFGRQRDSFQSPLQSQVFKKLSGTFIRAPRITHINVKAKPACEILATYEKEPVLIRQGNLLAGTFHPEIDGDTQVHAYFVKITNDSLQTPNA